MGCSTNFHTLATTSSVEVRLHFLNPFCWCSLDDVEYLQYCNTKLEWFCLETYFRFWISCKKIVIKKLAILIRRLLEIRRMCLLVSTAVSQLLTFLTYKMILGLSIMSIRVYLLLHKSISTIRNCKSTLLTWSWMLF